MTVTEVMRAGLEAVVGTCDASALNGVSKWGVTSSGAEEDEEQDVPNSVSFVDTEGDTSTLRLDTATRQLSWHSGGHCYLQNISILEFDAARAAIIAPEHSALTARLVDPPAGLERDSLLHSIAVMARSDNAVQLRGFKEISAFGVVAEVFGRVMDASEQARVELAEAVWADGIRTRERGEVEEAAKLFEAAIDGRGKGLCADIKSGRDRVVEMRGELLTLRGEVGVAGMLEDKDYKIKVANDKVHLALDFTDRGDYAKALPLHEEAIVLYTEAYGDNSLRVADAHHDIAAIYNMQGHYEEALVEYQKCVDTTMKSVCDATSVFALTKTYCNMGIVYKNQGKYEEALKYYQKGLEICVSITPLDHMHMWSKEDHMHVAGIFGNIGVLYTGQGHYEKAMVEYQKALDIQISREGLDHLDVARMYNNMGVVCKKQGQYEKALEYYHKDLEITVRILGLDHSDVAVSKSNLGNLFGLVGKWVDALEMFKGAAATFRATLGPEHPETKQAESKTSMVSLMVSLNI